METVAILFGRCFHYLLHRGAAGKETARSGLTWRALSANASADGLLLVVVAGLSVSVCRVLVYVACMLPTDYFFFP